MSITSSISSETQGAARQQSYRYLERGLPRTLEAGPTEGQDAPEKLLETPQPGFGDLVKGFVADVNDLQLDAGRSIDAFAAGEITDVHQVMVAVQEAGLALDLLLEVRNRTMEAFQEIMRMQV